MASCAACGKAFRVGEPKTTTLTGRTVHEDCGANLIAASAGAAASPGAPVVGAIATEGWFKRLRLLRRKGREAGGRPPVHELRVRDAPHVMRSAREDR